MAVDSTFHYPPDLFQLMVTALSKLCKGKDDLLLFFRGAGVPRSLLSDLQKIVKEDRDSIYKTQIARKILTRLNEKGDAMLGVRRELLRRVVQFDNFSECWERDRAAAKGHVAEIRQLVEAKDSFTRMRQERDRERQARIDQQEARLAKLRAIKEARAQVCQQLYGLFKEDLDPHQRGRDFETVMNDLFRLDGISLKEPFTRKGPTGKIVEQIDGVVEIAGHIYLVEVKWHKEPVGIQDVQVLGQRLFVRPGQPRGLFISASGFSEPAFQAQREVANQKILILCHLSEIVQALEREEKVGSFFKKQADRAITDLSSVAAAR